MNGLMDSNSDFNSGGSQYAPDSNKEFLDIQGTILSIYSETRPWHDKNIQSNNLFI